MDTAGGGFPRLLRLHCLFHLGGVSSVVPRKLRLLVQWKRRRLFVALFLAGNFLSGTVPRAGPPRLVGRSAGLVAGVADFLAGVSDVVGAGRVPFHLLLLSRRLLQGILGRPARTAPSASRARAISANAISRSSCKTSTAISCIWRCCSFSFSRYDAWKAMWFTDDAAWNISASASERSC